MMERKRSSNIGLKILSLLFAVSLWFFVTYRGQSEMIVDAPIEFRNVPKGIELVKQNLKSVSVNIRGHERPLKNLRPMDVRVVLNMSGARKGENNIYFDKDNVVVPRTIKVLRVEPTSAKVDLDESVTKVLPVKVQLVGTLERGYTIKAINVSPPTVVVEGARSELAKIAVLKTDPVDITGFESDLTQNVHINTNNINVRTRISDVTVKILVKGGR